MLRNRFARRLALTGLMSLMISGCFHPPYNNFRPDNHALADGAVETGIGAAVGSVGGFVAGATLTGTAIGAVAFAAHSVYKDSKPYIIRQLKKRQIQYEQYGDTVTLIVPTDRYYLFNSPRFNEPCYRGLLLILKILQMSPCTNIYVAGFTDNIGSRYHKNKLSQAQAETMLTFLWANGFDAKHLDSEGYGEKNDVSDNKIIHGSAQNRRIEIQCVNIPPGQVEPMPYLGPTK